MQIHRIPSGVGFDSNIYLIVAERTMLVDTGSGLGHDLVVKGIRSLLDGRPLDMIVLTHCHYDHMGGLSALMEEFSCPAFAAEPDAECIRTADDRYILASEFGSSVSPSDVSPLYDGQVIDLGGTSLKVILTPGHTRGSLCLYEESTGALVSGDTLFEIGVGRTDFPGGSMSSLRSSLESLSNIDIRELYPGHGNICKTYGPAMMARIMTLVGM